MEEKRKALEAEIKALKEELAELEAGWPAHSPKPSRLLRIEEVEEALEGKEAELAGLKKAALPG